METQNGRHDPRGTGPESVFPERFHISESTADGRRVIALCGELDLSTAPQLKERLAGNVATFLDLSDLSFIDSTGIHVVATTAQRAQSEGWEFTVRNPQPGVLRVFKLVGLDQHVGLESQPGPDIDGKQPFPAG
jgi:anti-sigma B factor antagonist